MSAPFLAQVADQQKLAWVRGGIVSVVLDGDATDSKLAVLRSRLPAGATLPVHVHSREDEICVLREGTAIFWVGDQRHFLSAGDVIVLPRTIPHAYRCTSDTADLLTLCTRRGSSSSSGPSAGTCPNRHRTDGLPPPRSSTPLPPTTVNSLGPPLGPSDTMPAAYLTATGKASASFVEPAPATHLML